MRALPSQVFRILILLAIMLLPLQGFGCAGKPPLLAATYTVTDWSEAQMAIDSARSGDSIDMGKLWSPKQPVTLKIPANLDITLIGNGAVTFRGVAIECGGHNRIAIESLRITALNNQAGAALTFSGKSNHLTIHGDNYVSNSPSANKAGYGAGVGVAEGVELSIQGTGSLHVLGYNGGAGIGGGQNKSAGTVTIDLVEAQSGTDLGNLYVHSFNGGAGIGGGSGGKGGNITVNQGNISLFVGSDNPVELNRFTLTKNLESIYHSTEESGSVAAGSAAASGAKPAGAGIGGGNGGSGGSITINGSWLNIRSYGNGACIGGGAGGEGGQINISGGHAVLENFGLGAGLGGGYQATAGSINITAGSLEIRTVMGAVNGTIRELPIAYQWFSGNGFTEQPDQYQVYPGEPYEGGSTAKMLKIEAAEVLLISIDPANADVAKGSEQQFYVQVQAIGGASFEYRLSVTGHTSQETYIDSEGILHVGHNETAETITVTATSVFDNDLTANASVTITNAAGVSPQ